MIHISDRPTPGPTEIPETLVCPACVRARDLPCETCHGTRYVTRAEFAAWHEVRQGRPGK